MSRLTDPPAPSPASSPGGVPSGPDGGDGVTAGGPQHHPEIDWEAAERSPEFQELVAKRRSFVLPALGFVFLWYFGFIALAGYAPDFMGERITGGFTVGYALALSQFVMTWVLGWLYLRRADRVFDPLSRKAAQRALERSAPAVADSDGHDGHPQERRGEEVRH